MALCSSCSFGSPWFDVCDESSSLPRRPSFLLYSFYRDFSSLPISEATYPEDGWLKGYFHNVENDVTGGVHASKAACKNIDLSISSFWENVRVQFMLAALIMLPPTLLMGAAFPIVCNILARDVRRT